MGPIVIRLADTTDFQMTAEQCLFRTHNATNIGTCCSCCVADLLLCGGVGMSVCVGAVVI